MSICRDCGAEIRIQIVYINGYMKRKYFNFDGTTHRNCFDFAAQEC